MSTSLQFQAILQVLQANINPVDVSLAQRRAIADMMAAQTPLLDGAYLEEIDIPSPNGQALPALLLAASAAADDRMILLLHGGGYATGSLITHRDLACRLSAVSGARVLLLGYRLAPEHPYPAAVDDALAAWQWLRDQGLPAQQILIGGDSAGGGLALALLLRLRAAESPLPRAAFGLSPWTDLALTGPSLQTNAATDPSLTVAQLEEYVAWYLAGTDPRTPQASPLYADLTGLPPLFIQVGTAEILYDDAHRLAQKAAAAGVTATLDEWPEMIHGWQGFAGIMPEAFEALERVGEFVQAQFS